MKNKRKKRIKPNAEVSRYRGAQEVHIVEIPLEKINIRTWHPDRKGEKPAEQVHITFPALGAEMGIRFTRPETLGFIIEELIAYRSLVWPDAEPINADASLEDGNMPEIIKE